MSLVEQIKERIELCKTRVERADKQNDRINSAYHGGEVASLNYVLNLIQGTDPR